MGSMITRLYLSKYSSLLQGVVICGTADQIQHPKQACCFGKQVIAKKGEFSHSSQLQKLIFGSYNNRCSHPKMSGHGLAGMTKWWMPTFRTHCVDSVYCICLSGFVVPAIFLQHPGMVQNTRPKSSNAVDFGAMDPVGNYGKGIRMIEKATACAGVSDLTVWIYPGARHELLNETNRDEVMRDVLSWFALHV